MSVQADQAGSGPGFGGMLSPTTYVRAAGATGDFTARSVRSVVRRGRDGDPDGIPGLTRMSPGLVLSVFGEELMLLSAGTIDEREISPDVLRRRSDETDFVLERLDAHGFLDDPASFHRPPPAPEDYRLHERQFAHVPYETLSFASGFEPLAGLPGSDHWGGDGPNGRVHASVLEHPDGPRPWLVWLHPYGMGRPMDLLFTGAQRYHRELGFNVLLPVLPLHGPRRLGRASGDGLMSLEWVDNVHAITHAVWDVRRCLEWIRGRGAESIAVHGMSLGGFVTALVSGLEELDCVVIGGAGSTLHEPLVNACSRNPKVRRAMESYDLLGDRVDLLHRVITPTAMPCLVPHDRRFIYAGLADRFAPPSQTHELWEHWDRPTIMWSPTSHLTTLTSGKVRHFVRDALATSAREPVSAHRRVVRLPNACAG